jgi:hypothetical protein
MTDPILIALTGRAGSGKDAAADHLCEQYGFERAAFADTLKDMLCEMFNQAGLDYAHIYEPDLKNEVIPELGVSARHLMQTLGTEWGRAVRPDLWVVLLARRLGMHDLPNSAPVHDRIVITDCRFSNEAAWIASMGGHLLRLHRDQAGAVREHVSENWIDTMPTFADLWNNGPTLEGLYGLLDGAMASLDIERRDPGMEAWR